jgi:hypothetical protein
MADADAPGFPGPWSNCIERIAEVLPLPITVALGLSFPFVPGDVARDIAYLLICAYEFLKVWQGVARRAPAAGDAGAGGVWCSRHPARLAVSAVLWAARLAPLCVHVSELLYFAAAALRALALEAGVRFPARRARCRRLSRALRRSPRVRNARAALEIAAGAELLARACRAGGAPGAVAFAVYFVCVIMRGIACDVRHGVVYRELADLVPRALAASPPGWAVEAAFDCLVWVSEGIWPIGNDPL